MIRFLQDPANLPYITALLTAIAGGLVVMAIDTAIESFDRSRGIKKRDQSDEGAKR